MRRLEAAPLLALALVALGSAACSRQPSATPRRDTTSSTMSGMNAPLMTSNIASGAYVPPATFHGDGATSDGDGGWTTGSAAAGQCLSCHDGSAASDMRSYLLTGHKNILRKFTLVTAPSLVWRDAGGNPYFTTDSAAGGSLYLSDSTFDWTTGRITVGDGADYAPAPLPFPYSSTSLFNPLAPAGSTQQIFYVFGGWSDPTALDAVFKGGFTGEQFPAGNYDCARCHTTGYRFDDTGDEPTFLGAKIAAADFSRVPSDFACSDGVSVSYAACVASGGTAVTASWMQDGVQCERCHNADGGHTGSGSVTGVTKPVGEAATALCLQCHREENIDTANNQFTFGDCSDGTSPDLATCTGGGGAWTTDLVVYDGGSCSDGVSADFASCTSLGGTWSSAPFFDHESGPTFLNSPHARFSGAMSVQAQNVTDMTVLMNGTYDSAFQDPATGTNAGCAGCHDVHKSLTQGTVAAFNKRCLDCHPAYADILTRIDHPQVAGTPFDGNADLSDSCAVCHMSKVAGTYHLFRISTDPGYSTFPPAAQIYNGGALQADPNTASDGKLANAVWTDVDLACGQCHGGSMFAPQPGVAALDKQFLAGWARCIHHEPVIHTAATTHGSVSLPGTTFLGAGQSATIAFTPDAGYEVKSITVDRMILTGAWSSYTFSDVTDCHTLSVSFGELPHITATAGGGGTISPPGVTSVNTGSSVTYTITPNAGYLVQTVIVDGATAVFAGASATPVQYTFSNVKGNHTIAASFVPVPAPAPTSFTISITASGGGTVTGSQDANTVRSGTGTEIVPKGGSITFKFTPDAGYKVGILVVDGTMVSPVPSSFTFTSLRCSHAISVGFYPGP